MCLRCHVPVSLSEYYQRNTVSEQISLILFFGMEFCQMLTLLCVS